MKTLNRIFLLCLFFIFVSCKSQSIKEIKVYRVDLDIDTPFCIKCGDFNKFFNTDIDSVVITNSIDIDRFANEINKLKVANDSIYSLPNTRYKMVLKHLDGTIEVICGDNFTVYHRNKLLIVSKSLINRVYTIHK